jgi:hypothetical protein
LFRTSSYCGVPGKWNARLRRTFRHMVVGTRVVPHQLQDELHDLHIAALVAGTDQVRLADPALRQDQVHGRVSVTCDNVVRSPA